MDVIEARTKHVPAWQRRPADVTPPKDIDHFKELANQYFEECADTDTRPTITGFALAVGLPGPTSLIRLGQRIPELRYVISRCMMTVSSHYEEMIGFGNAAGPMFMLKNIPDFDPDEPIGSPSVQFFNDRKEVLLSSNVVGAARSDSEHDKEDPVEAYIRLIKQRGYIQSDEQPASNVLRTTERNTPRRRALTIITEGWEDE